MQLLDGKKISSELFLLLKPRVNALNKSGVHPKLVFFLVGENPSSVAYVKMKKKACEKIGILSETIKYEELITVDKLINHIYELNNDPNVTGMMVQLPLPAHLSVPEITRALDPHKDADGFHAYNFGKMALSKSFEHLPPATALGIVRLIEAYDIDVSGMNVTVLGRSNLVGKPIAIMLINRSATVTVCHSQTRDTKKHCQQADMIISATGVPRLVKADWIKEGAIVIDAGYSSVNGKVTGDVDFDSVSHKCSWITPVPGGCGPMTIYSIVENTITAAERQLHSNPNH